MSDPVIQQLFEADVQAWADDNDYLAVFANAKAEPENAPHLEAFVMPATTVNGFLDGEHEAHTGVFQLNIKRAKGEGMKPYNDAYSSLKALFHVNRRMTKNGLTMQIITPLSKFQGLVSGNYFLVPMSCRYRLDITN